jgi:hypothetical protein
MFCSQYGKHRRNGMESDRSIVDKTLLRSDHAAYIVCNAQDGEAKLSDMQQQM